MKSWTLAAGLIVVAGVSAGVLLLRGNGDTTPPNEDSPGKRTVLAQGLTPKLPAAQDQSSGGQTKADTIKPDIKGKPSQPPTPAKSEGFAFTQDSLGQRLAELLPPELESIKKPGRKPLTLPPPRWLEQPEVSMPSFQWVPIRPEAAARDNAKPVNPREDAPLARQWESPNLPEVAAFPTSGLIRLPTIDVESPLPLPILANPSRDRVSLADPTQDASLAAALAAQMPLRTDAVPFSPMNLPNPFEHHGPAKLRNPPPEDPIPAVSTPRLPTK